MTSNSEDPPEINTKNPKSDLDKLKKLEELEDAVLLDGLNVE